MVMRSRATDGRSVSKCQRKWPDQPPTTVRAARGDGSCPNYASALQGARETANIQAGSGVIWRIPVYINFIRGVRAGLLERSYDIF